MPLLAAVTIATGAEGMDGNAEWLLASNETYDQRPTTLKSKQCTGFKSNKVLRSLCRLVRTFARQEETAFLERAIKKEGEYTVRQNRPEG